ncbi:DUF1419 domain-containing protein [Mesorhizobium sp. M0643]|uniref:DUF1419 domain-containing protein n=1 Tax=Mesorhizobium sp. M0643 TaxID=2956978 RepID=UPI00333AC6D6
MTAHPPFRKVLDGVATREEMFSLFNRHRDDAGVDPLCGSIYAAEWFEILESEYRFMLALLPPLLGHCPHPDPETGGPNIAANARFSLTPEGMMLSSSCSMICRISRLTNSCPPPDQAGTQRREATIKVIPESCRSEAKRPY